jgi:hypothetical protein
MIHMVGGMVRGRLLSPLVGGRQRVHRINFGGSTGLRFFFGWRRDHVHHRRWCACRYDCFCHDFDLRFTDFILA